MPVGRYHEYTDLHDLVEQVFSLHSLSIAPHVKHVSDSPAPEAVTPLLVAASIARAAAGRF